MMQMKMKKTLMRTAFLSVVIGMSLLFGALIHAYANSNTNPEAANIQGNGTSYQTASHHKPTIVNTSLTKKTVDVCPGDTLWDIAASHLPEGESVRSYMSKIKKANNLKNSDLASGQILVLP